MIIIFLGVGVVLASLWRGGRCVCVCVCGGGWPRLARGLIVKTNGKMYKQKNVKKNAKKKTPFLKILEKNAKCRNAFFTNI